MPQGVLPSKGRRPIVDVFSANGDPTASRQIEYSDAWPPGLQAANSKLLKKDVFGQVSLVTGEAGRVITRDIRCSRWWLRWIARQLMSREASALLVLHDVPQVPRLLLCNRDTLYRSWLDGEPMQRSRPRDVRYFKAATRLLRSLHRRGIAHNDLAKEPNWLVTPDGRPAIVDFQLSFHSPSRGRLFRMMAREDLRHLLKHKRTYCGSCLTEREKRILATPAPISRIWMLTGKPLYVFITRRLLGWSDREGAGDR
jgi:predicted Ser/Thr protein kinase